MIEDILADTHELRCFERLAAAAGPTAALKLCAFMPARNLYIPSKAEANHVLTRLIGETEAGWLCQELAGETVWVPALEMKALRQAGRLRDLRRRAQFAQRPTGSLGAPEQAAEMSLSERHTRRVMARLLSLEGYSALAAEVDE